MPRLVEAAIALAVIVLDQVTKALVRHDLRLYETYEIIPGLASLVHGRNVGMAFGVLSGGGLPAQAVVLAVLSGVVLLVVLAHWRRLAEGPILLRIALALIAGGALGNLLARLPLRSPTHLLPVSSPGHDSPAFT